MPSAHAGDDIGIDASGVQPRVVVGSDAIAVVYARAETILVASSTDGGATFGKPVAVASVPKLMAGMRRGPQIALAGKSLVVAAIGAQDGNVVAWRSGDLGKTWTGPATVNDSARSAAEGLFSIAAGRDESVWAVWLDLRDKATKVVLSHSSDGGASWAANTVAYQAPGGSVCECCQPSIAADASGAIAILWRNHVGEARDMWAMTSADEGKTFTPAAKLGKGTWKLAACPMDGGGIAISGATATAIWRREDTVYASKATSGVERALGRGRNGTVAIAGRVAWRAWQDGDDVLLAADDAQPITVGAGSYPHLGAGSGANSPVILVRQRGDAVVARRVDR